MSMKLAEMDERRELGAGFADPPAAPSLV